MNLNNQFSKKMQDVETSAIRRAFERAAKLKNPINFSIGQPHFSCPTNILQAIDKALQEGKTSYTLTAGIPQLKDAIISKYERDYQTSIKQENVLITSGVSSALLLLFQAILNEGDNCLMIEPYFLMYPFHAKLNQANCFFISENFTKEDLEKLQEQRFKLIIYCSPSNPTGKILSKEQIKILSEFSKKQDAYLISDEIYEAFDYNKKFCSITSIDPKAITVSGFSKSYSMTGLRLSWIIAPKEMIEILTALQQYTIVCAPSVVQWAGIEALKTDIHHHIEDYHQKRDYVFEHLKNYYEDFQKSDGAFYFFFKVRYQDEIFVEKAANEKNLILVPGNIFTRDQNHIRLSFATDWDKLKKGVEILKELA